MATGIQNNIKNIDSTNYTFNKNYTIPKINSTRDDDQKNENQTYPLSGISNNIKSVAEDKKYDGDVSIKNRWKS